MTYQLTSGWPQHIESGAFVNPETNQDYLAWLAEGNEPLPAPEPPVPVELTPAEKLANAGLTVDELKTLLGLS